MKRSYLLILPEGDLPILRNSEGEIISFSPKSISSPLSFREVRFLRARLLSKGVLAKDIQPVQLPKD